MGDTTTSGSWGSLATARKALDLTQSELGQQVAKLLGASISDAAAQKKISLWENFKARPSAAELDALAVVLRSTPEFIQSWFPANTPQFAPAIFHELAISDSPSLIVACFSGRPRAVSSAEVRQTLLQGLNRHLSLAMVMPYPARVALPDITEWTVDDPATDLQIRYHDVYSDVLQLKCSFESELLESRRNSLKMYRPKLGEDSANVLIPPVAARYTLIVKEVGPRNFVPELWTWVESEDLDGLFRVGSITVEKAAPQVRAWRSYFGDIVDKWMEHHLLTEDARHWEVVK